MDREAILQLRYIIGAAIGVPLVLAIAIPLYLSGSPSLSARLVEPTATSQIIAQVTPTATTPPEPTNQPDDPSPTSTATQEVQSGPTATYPPALPHNEDVVAVVQGLLEGQTGVYGIIISRPNEYPDVSQNEDIPFMAASLYKLVLLADIYEGVQNGVISLDQELPLLPEYFPGPDEPADSYFDAETAPESVQISEALFATGAYSSNVAAHVLLSLTDELSLEATAREIGMNHTYFYVDPRDLAEWPPTGGPDDDPAALAEAVAFIEEQADAGPLMITTPRDIATYFDRLLEDRVIDAEVSAGIMEILSQQAVDDRFPCLLPAGTEMAHKTGNLDHVVHDVGIIWSPEGPVILVAMVQDPPDDSEATLLVQRLALLAYSVAEDPYIVLDVPGDPVCSGLVPAETDLEAETVEETGE